MCVTLSCPKHLPHHRARHIPKDEHEFVLKKMRTYHMTTCRIVEKIARSDGTDRGTTRDSKGNLLWYPTIFFLWNASLAIPNPTKQWQSECTQPVANVPMKRNRGCWLRKKKEILVALLTQPLAWGWNGSLFRPCMPTSMPAVAP